jgi:hypothetical protein
MLSEKEEPTCSESSHPNPSMLVEIFFGHPSSLLPQDIERVLQEYFRNIRIRVRRIK